MPNLHEGVDFDEVLTLLRVSEIVATGQPAYVDLGRAARARLNEIQEQVRKNELEAAAPKATPE